MNSLVSIIVPVYNRKDIIIFTINSILKQTYQNFELIIVDDCSTDGTYDYLNKKFRDNNKIRLFQTKKNSGTCAYPRNLGLKKSKGQIICFCDSDDFWEKEKLKIQLSKLKSRNQIITTGAKYFSRNYKSSTLINFLRQLLQLFIINKINKFGAQWFYLYNPIIISSVMLYKEVLKKNKFDESQNTREDLDLWIRLKKKNFKFIYIKKILVNIKRSTKSMSSNHHKEFIVIIKSLSEIYLKLNNFKRLDFFLTGIIVKFFLLLLKKNVRIINSYLKKIVFYSFTIFFIIFYTPLFWYLGNPLLYYDKDITKKEKENIIVFSGHGSTSYYNITYQYRYRDIVEIIKEADYIENIYILGRIREIPEQKILESLLVNYGVDKSKINLIYEDYQSTYNNILNIHKILKEKNISEITFVTSPYHSKRAKLYWKSFKDLKVKFWKGFEWPTKNNFLEYAKNKKIILYEYTSIIYNYLKGNIN